MLIFAYGSNLYGERMRARAPSAQPIAVARLPGHTLRFHKRSVDGSGKADAFETGDPADEVWGVVYRIDPAHKPALDAAESLGIGYDEHRVRVLEGDRTRETCTYRAILVDPDLRPYAWYKRYVVAGAREHRLPGPYLRRIEAVEAIADPDVARAESHALG